MRVTALVLSIFVSVSAWADDPGASPAVPQASMITAPPVDVGAPVQNAATSVNNDPVSDLPVSVWAENCHSNLGQEYTDLKNRVRNSKDAEGVWLATLEKAIETSHQIENQGFPDRLDEGDEIATIYNQFVGSSRKFMESIDPKSGKAEQHQRCGLGARDAAKAEGALASQIQATKKFLLIRQLIGKYAREAARVSRGNTKLQAAVSEKMQAQIRGLRQQIENCPASVWKVVKEKFVYRPAPEKTKALCPDFDQYKKSSEELLNGVIASLKSDSPVAEPETERHAGARRPSSR